MKQGPNSYLGSYAQGVEGSAKDEDDTWTNRKGLSRVMICGMIVDGFQFEGGERKEIINCSLVSSLVPRRCC